LNGNREGLAYADSIKPFNFMSSVQVSPMGQPVGVDRDDLHLIAAYRGATEVWTDFYLGREFKITAESLCDPDLVKVESYGDILTRHPPRSKSQDVNGLPCSRSSRGALSKRQIYVGDVYCIGKRVKQYRARSKRPQTLVG